VEGREVTLYPDEPVNPFPADLVSGVCFFRKEQRSEAAAASVQGCDRQGEYREKNKKEVRHVLRFFPTGTFCTESGGYQEVL
jgi:hypothetical protein